MATGKFQMDSRAASHTQANPVTTATSSSRVVACQYWATAPEMLSARNILTKAADDERRKVTPGRAIFAY